jgi:hypothetical protein
MANHKTYFGLLPLPEDCSRDMWTDYKRHIVRVVDELDKQHDELNEKSKDLKAFADPLPWMVGDWLLAGVRLGEKSGELKEGMQQYLKERGRKGYTTGAMGNMMTICKAFPVSRRRESLSIWYHWEIYKFSEEDQDRLLDMAEPEMRLRKRMKPMTIRDLKAQIAQMQSVGHLPKDSRPPIIAVDRARETVILKIRIGRAKYAFLKAIQPNTISRETALQIIQQYIDVNIDALMARAVKHDPRWATMREVLVRPLADQMEDTRPDHFGREPLPRIYPKS